jgi:hypothetical protein
VLLHLLTGISRSRVTVPLPGTDSPCASPPLLRSVFLPSYKPTGVIPSCAQEDAPDALLSISSRPEVGRWAMP